MAIADSSFLVSLFVPHDENHEKAKEKFIKTNEEILIPDIILYETLTVINYKLGYAEKKSIFQKIISNSSFVVEHLTPSELKDTLNSFILSESKLSFPDVLVLNLATKRKSEILVFDKNIIKEINIK
ncbi:MAG: PIN domain-containing protein [Candidatus Micrarchaeia archaeon]